MRAPQAKPASWPPLSPATQDSGHPCHLSLCIGRANSNKKPYLCPPTATRVVPVRRGRAVQSAGAHHRADLGNSPVLCGRKRLSRANYRSSIPSQTERKMRGTKRARSSRDACSSEESRAPLKSADRLEKTTTDGSADTDTRAQLTPLGATATVSYPPSLFDTRTRNTAFMYTVSLIHTNTHTYIHTLAHQRKRQAKKCSQSI